MNTKLVLAVFLIIAVHTAVLNTKTISIIAANLETTTTETSIIAKNLVVSDLIRIPPIPTQEADVYFGSTEINIESGDKKRIDFFGTFVPNTENCSYSKCYYGWIDNYTITGEETVLSLNNQTLAIKPVFEFKTNS